MRFAEVARRQKKYDQHSDEVKEWRALLRVRDRELVETTKRLSSIEAQLEAQISMRAELEMKVQSMEAELKRSHKQQGVKELLLSPHGQRFLEILHHDLLKAYRKTPYFLYDLGKGIGHFICEGGREALKQFGASKSEMESIDWDTVIDKVKDPIDLLDIDINMEHNHPWWLPAMEAAAEVLVRGDVRDPSLSRYGRRIKYPVLLGSQESHCSSSSSQPHSNG